MASPNAEYGAGMDVKPNDEENKKLLATLHAMESVSAEESGRTWLGIRIWVIQSILGSVALVGVWFYFAPARAELAKFKRAESEKAVQTAALQKAQREDISALAQQYDAITDWRGHLSGRTAFDTIYSAELSAALVNRTGHLTLFIAELKDVGLTDGGNYVLLLDGFVNLRTHFILRLSCNDDQARKIMSAPRREEDRFAVVVAINAIGSDAGTTVDDKASLSGHRPGIPISGTLVDFRSLGPYPDDLQEILSAFKKLQGRSDPPGANPLLG